MFRLPAARVRQRQRRRHIGAVGVAHHDVGQVQRRVFGVALRRVRLVAVGASLTAMPVITLLPVMAGATPSLTLVAIVEAAVEVRRRRKRQPASSALTSAIAPEAVQTPVPAI